VYLITSDGDVDPATLAAWVRGHWEIENRLHWVRSPGRAWPLHHVAPTRHGWLLAADLLGCGARGW
jgi:hypothetical protein